MPDTPFTLSPSSSSQLELRLLRRATFAAAYLPQVIDFVVRGAVGSEFTDPSDQEAEQIHRHLVRYAASGQPGAQELAHTMLDIRHAIDLVRHELYRAAAVPGVGLDLVVSASRLLELAAAAGCDRVLPAQGGALVLAESGERSTVYRPVSAAEAREVRVAARTAKEGAIRLHERVVEALSPHVRMANWSKEEGFGVAVDIERDTVSVQWWPASLPETRAMWEQGGIRQLCKNLLSASFLTTETVDSGQALQCRVSKGKVVITWSGRGAVSVPISLPYSGHPRL
ncbi:hypothetical protein OG369_39915 [Streptomyces sp. NBC_01221]|uniref:hypothetical protein n=1 Tax=Streptomyces sp. NBC_01221 TaxID=2903782 RepID=UPI002258CB43|nr:hypothetical protein [Streptomyces sp. NBC_01221]MCX4792017.1 hypothetical protein [Streptomyces sp. NBC_01221]